MSPSSNSSPNTIDFVDNNSISTNKVSTPVPEPETSNAEINQNFESKHTNTQSQPKSLEMVEEMETLQVV